MHPSSTPTTQSGSVLFVSASTSTDKPNLRTTPHCPTRPTAPMCHPKSTSPITSSAEKHSRPTSDNESTSEQKKHKTGEGLRGDVNDGESGAIDSEQKVETKSDDGFGFEYQFSPSPSPAGSQSENPDQTHHDEQSYDDETVRASIASIARGGLYNISAHAGMVIHQSAQYADLQATCDLLDDPEADLETLKRRIDGARDDALQALQAAHQNTLVNIVIVSSDLKQVARIAIRQGRMKTVPALPIMPARVTNAVVNLPSGMSEQEFQGYYETAKQHKGYVLNNDQRATLQTIFDVNTANSDPNSLTKEQDHLLQTFDPIIKNAINDALPEAPALQRESRIVHFADLFNIAFADSQRHGQSSED